MRRDRGSLDRHGDGKPFSGENLADDFGSQSAVTREGIGALYRALVGDDSPEVPAALNRWKRLKVANEKLADMRCFVHPDQLFQ